MRRNRIMMVVFIVLSAAGCQTIHVDRPAVVGDHAWTVDGRTQQRSRMSVDVVQPPLELAWKYNASAGFGPGSPLIVKDQLLVGNRKGEMHGIDLETGKRRGYHVFNDAIEATPVIDNGRMYVPSAWGNRAIQAFDLEKSSVVWRVDGVPVEVPLVVDGDMVLAVDVEGVVRSYSAADGQAEWSIRLGERLSVLAAPLLVSPGHMFVATDTGRMVLLDTREGRILWQIDSGLPVHASPSTDGERIVVPTTRGIVLALDAMSGTEQWRFDTDNATARIGGVALTADAVVFGATDAHVRSLDARSGALNWTEKLDAVVAAPPQLTPGMVWIGTMGRQLLGLEAATGQVVWSMDLEGRMKSAMATTEGALYVLIEPRYVLKLVPRTTETEIAP